MSILKMIGTLDRNETEAVEDQRIMKSADEISLEMLRTSILFGSKEPESIEILPSSDWSEADYLMGAAINY